MEKFTAAQARGMMPDRVKEIVEKTHNYVRTAAKEGHVETEVVFRGDINVDKSAWKAKEILEEEGYHVIFTETDISFSYLVDWRQA